MIRWNLATAVAGWRGRDHLRIFPLFLEPGAAVIVGAVHREQRLEWFWTRKKPCVAVESFDAPRKLIEPSLNAP